MIRVYALGQTGVKFDAVLLDQSNKYDTKPADLTDAPTVYMKFTRPKGKIISKPAEIESGKIVYTDSSTESLLDVRGDWTFTPGIVTSDGTIIENPEGELFWVI